MAPGPSRPITPQPRLTPKMSRPIAVEPYPLASTRRRDEATAPRRTGRKDKPSHTVPLWSPESEAAPPTPSASGANNSVPSPSPDAAGEGEEKGVVVEAHPIGRVDLATPGFMKLQAAEIVAIFEISADGAVASVTLRPGTGIANVDAEIVAYLKTTTWAPKTVGGVAVAGTQEMEFSKDSR